MDDGHTKTYKIKMYIAFFMTILLTVIAVYTLVNPYSYSSSAYTGGGKGGFIVIILAVLNGIFYPLLGDYAISGSVILLTFISGVFTYYYYKKSKT